MPDKQEFFQPTSISRPTQEINRFGLEAARDFPQPVALLGAAGAEVEGENLDINNLLRTLTGRAATSGLEKFSRSLQNLPRARKKIEEIENEWMHRAPLPGEYDRWEKAKKEPAEIRERLSREYNGMMSQQIGVVDDVFRISIDQKKNAYPYDHRTAELTVRTTVETAQALTAEETEAAEAKAAEAIKDLITRGKIVVAAQALIAKPAEVAQALQEQELAKNPEVQIWLQRMEQDASWLAALLQVTVAESAMAPDYHDVMLQIQVMKERYKATITADDLIVLNAKDVPGFGFDAKQKTLIQDEGIGLTIPNKYQTEAVNLTNGETLGLRELGVKMREQSFSIRMKMAAVSQIDFSEVGGEEKTFMGKNLKPGEISFYRRLLWVNKKPKEPTEDGEGYILAPHMVSEAGEKKKVATILEAMLVTNASKRLNDIITGGLGDSDKADAIQRLADSVTDVANKRLEEWKTRGKDIVSNLAILTTRQGLYEDYAQLHVYRYCWQFLWTTDNKGQIKSKMKAEAAGPHSYSGDAYSLYYMKRAAYYDKLGNSRTQFLLPTSKGGRAELKGLPYDKMPHFDPKEICLDGENVPNKIDEFLEKQWNFLFGKDQASVEARKALGYGDIQEDVAKRLQEWAVKWRTPYSSKFVEDGTDYELEVPHLFSSGLDIANFYESITTGDVKLNKGGKTVWQELIEGSTLSKIDWNKLGDWPLDRWYVDLDMASNYMKILIETFDNEKDPFYSFVTSSPGTLGPKKLANKIRLSLRDSAKGMSEEYEVALIPFFITMACVNKYELASPDAWNIRSDGKAKTTAVENFLAEMAVWQRAFKWLPSDRPDGSLLSYKPKQYDEKGKEVLWNYGNTMALIAEFYIAVLLRVSKSTAEESVLLTSNNYKNTSTRVDSMPFIGTGHLDRKVNTSIPPSN